MPDTMRLDNVPGSHIIFRNFRGRPTPVTREGDRSFCLIIPNRLIRDQLAARGCKIKKFSNIENGYVRVAVRFVPPENVDNIWEMLDVDQIDNASLEFTFYEWNINGKKGTRIYLKNARFYVKGFNNNVIIDIRYPGYITCKVDNTNNTEETNMEKIMSVEEIISRFGVLEYVYNSCKSEDKKALKDIMEAVRAAKYYLIPRSADRCERLDGSTTNKPTVTGYELEKTGDFASIKQVIFNDPATIVVWFDDVKTVVKCQEGDTFDKEKGLAMAICKRLYGNESNFNNLIKKWTEPNVKKAVKKAIKKVDKKKALDKARKNVKDNSNVIITDAYAYYVRVKMAKRGIKSYNELAKMCGVSQTTFSRSFGNAKRKSRVMYRSTFNKINKTLGIRWG